MKNEMRSKYLKMRREMSLEEQLSKSEIIKNKLLESEEYKTSQWVFTYIDMGAEVRTIPFIEQAWKDKKRVAVPIAKKNRLMYFVEITSFDNLNRTSLGVMEPNISIENKVMPTENTMFIVPGSVFDMEKNRCGYGGGYYDTYTEENNIEKTIGICYDCQLVGKIPVDHFDRKLYKIITEKQTIS
ncbi:MAG: 5-formyltetrahydrofolate cyclo-ligase [Anaerotignaceae bacterium]